MKVIIRINNFGSKREDREHIKEDVIASLNECGIAVLPSYCDVFVIENDRKEEP